MASPSSPENGHLKYSKDDLRRSAVFALSTFDNKFLLKPTQLSIGVVLTDEANLKSRVFTQNNPLAAAESNNSIEEMYTLEYKGRRRLASMTRGVALGISEDIEAALRENWSTLEPPLDKLNRGMFEEDPSGLGIIRARLDQIKESASVARIESAKNLPAITIDYIAADLEPPVAGPHDERIRKNVEEAGLSDSQKETLRESMDAIIRKGQEVNRLFRVSMAREILFDRNGVMPAPDGSIVPIDVVRYSAAKLVGERYEKAVWTYLIDFADPVSK